MNQYNITNKFNRVEKVYLAILNITSWAGQCSGATHLYGHLILCTKDISIENITDWNVKYLGENIEIRQVITKEIAEKLDAKDGHHTYSRRLRQITEDPELLRVSPEYGTVNRFDTFQEVVDAGIAKWEELKLECPFISLYEGRTYYANSYSPDETVILQYKPQ